MLIRQERPADFAVIHDLVQRAFETAKVSNGDEQNLVGRLRASGRYIPELALVAEDNGRIVGHVMLTPFDVEPAGGPHPLLLLAPLAVAIEHRGKGVGAGLVEAACSLAADRGHAGVILVGDPAYYGRLGFRRSVEFGIGNADDIPDAYVMARVLAGQDLRQASGTVTFRHL